MKKLIFTGIMLVTLFTACGEKAKESKPEEQKLTGSIHLTKAEYLSKVTNFETNPTDWKYLGDKPCIIDFYATWCGPCKTVAPILEEIANEYKGKIYVYKIDVDAQPEIAAAYGIQSIPTILFCPMTGNPQMTQGAMPKEAFTKTVVEVLLKK